MNTRLLWTLRIIGGVVVAWRGANTIAAILAQLVCNVWYAKTIGLGAAAGAQATLNAPNLWSVLEGWLLLLVAAFLFGARPRTRASTRTPWYRRFGVVLGLLCLLPLVHLGLIAGASEPPASRTVACAPEGARNLPSSTHQAPQRGSDPAFEARHNALGMRGPELSPDVPTIVVVGDSFVYGTGVADDQTITAQLQRLLPNHQVVNAGLQGDNLIGAIERARGLVAQLRPEALVIGLYTNDTTHGSTTTLCAMAPWCRPHIHYHRLDDIESHRLAEHPGATPWWLARLQESWSGLATALAERPIPVRIYAFRGLPAGVTPQLFPAPGLDVGVLTSGCTGREHYFDWDSSHPNPAGTACVAAELAPELRKALAPASPR